MVWTKLRYSSRVLVTILVAALVAVVAVFVAREVSGQWAQHQGAREMLVVNATVDNLLQAAQNLAFERGRTNVVLTAAGPVGDDNRAFLAARRQASEEGLAAAFALLRDNGGPDLAAVQDGHRRVAALRLEADAAMALPREQRPPDLAKRWVGALTAFLKDITGLVAATAQQRDRFLPAFRDLSRIKLLAFDLREAVGLESSRYAAALAGKPLDAATLADSMALRGRGDAAWDALRREVELTRSTGLAEALAAVDTEFFRRFRPVEDAVIKASRDGGPPPVTTAEYTRAAVPALDSIAGFLKAATTESATFAAAHAARAERRMTLSLAAGGVALVVGLAALYVIIIRLLRPLGHIQRDLQALAAGNVGIAQAPSARTDEIGRMANAVIAFRDSLVDRRRREHEVHDLAAKMQAILDNTPAGIIILAPDRTVREVNGTFCAMVGLGRDQLIGNTTRAIYRSDAQYDEIGRAAYPQLLAGETFRADLEIERANGPRLWVHVAARMINPDAPDLGIVWVVDDITRQKTMEMELRRSNDELEHFAYVASHDLRQPLRTISGFVTLLARKLGDRCDAEEKEWLDFVVKGASRLDRMIVALLDYSRIGREGVRPAEVDLAVALDRAVQGLGADIEAAEATVSLPESMPAVIGSEAEMERLFQNLIANALKFCRPDAPPAIAVACRDGGDHWVISVTDNGIGIAENEIGRLFGVFSRLVSHEQYEGTGIGLAACRKICEHHGGRIWVESQPGTGSTFSFALPKTPDAA
ncbi:ATP-binding protein [Magnetospirillum sp. UT-4]|uniref:ATP-binding protein n=1 Tax=Magnetospirillum sp. UT-4 TaxID=2681467 RepID=UPI00137F8205|nr:ATP-binding protein [Magnetospirillum sp. UT-4]CAA7611654.1 putative PAS:ATP-binding region, ATPase-like:Histidine kinase A-like [Magnetospirillum sp. UT-4]